jgi:hypothetical protein
MAGKMKAGIAVATPAPTSALAHIGYVERVPAAAVKAPVMVADVGSMVIRSADWRSTHECVFAELLLLYLLAWRDVMMLMIVSGE